MRDDEISDEMPCMMFSLLLLLLVARISLVIPVPVSPIDLFTADQCQLCLVSLLFFVLNEIVIHDVRPVN